LQAKVAVLGAAGGIGQPLSLLLKSNTLIGELVLYDVMNTAGVAADLSHISTPVKVKAFTGQAQLVEALKGCQLVIIPAGRQSIPVFLGTAYARHDSLQNKCK
jgi:malate dehydrogenase